LELLLLVRGLKTEFWTPRGVVHAVDGVDLEVGRGEVLGLVGESGCGKSVTALSIMYLVPQPPGRIASGEIWFNGIDLLAGAERDIAVKRTRRGRARLVRQDRLLRRHRARMNRIRGRDMSMIFQEPMSSLNPVLSVGDQVSEVLMYQRRQELCESLLSRKDLTQDDLDLFRRVVSTADPTERDHLLADFCVRTGLTAERVSAIVEESGLTMEARVQHIQRLARRRRIGMRWFIRLVKDLDALETERVDREWRRLSRASLAKIAAGEFDASQNPKAKGLTRLTRVSVTENAVRLLFASAPTEEHRNLIDSLVQKALLGPRGPMYALVGTVARGHDYVDLVFRGEEKSRVHLEASYRSRSLTYKLVTATPFLRTRLMRPLEEEGRRQVLELLKLVRIAEPSKVYHEYPHELSGGMQQRVMIAMALACDPVLMIADEPTTSLDVTTQAQILKLIADLRQRVNSAILYITHDLAVIAEISDRVAVMYAGKIVEDAPVDELFSRPLHPYTQGLLESIVSMDSRKVEVGAALPTIPGVVPDLLAPPAGCRFHPRCKYAVARCSTEEPALLGRGTPHKVACHLYDQEGSVAPGTPE
jgi:oligopeptide/dipeptide ABC transporter ATP-binding protein